MRSSNQITPMANMSEEVENFFELRDSYGIYRGEPTLAEISFES